MQQKKKKLRNFLTWAIVAITNPNVSAILVTSTVLGSLGHMMLPQPMNTRTKVPTSSAIRALQIFLSRMSCIPITPRIPDKVNNHLQHFYSLIRFTIVFLVRYHIILLRAVARSFVFRKPAKQAVFSGRICEEQWDHHHSCVIYQQNL